MGSGYNLTPGRTWLIQPQVSASYERYEEDRYTETDGGRAEPELRDLDADTVRAEVGLTSQGLRDLFRVIP